MQHAHTLAPPLAQRTDGATPALRHGWHDSPRLVAQRTRIGQLFGTVAQRKVTTDEAHTAAWNLPEYKAWLATRPVHASTLGLGPLPSDPDLTAMAQHQLAQMETPPHPVHHFASLDLLHTALRLRTGAVAADLLSPAVGVQGGDLDVAGAMYARLQHYRGEEAVLHKLDWRDAHHHQYHRRGFDEGAASTSGRVYGPWRATVGGVPNDGALAGSVNVHTMPLNVAWLLACCHHAVRLRLYVPLTERALFRNADAGLVMGADGQQRKLSALGRELVALLSHGLYRVGAVEQDPQAPLGFETTVVLEPTAQAAAATALQLTVANNLTPLQVRQTLFVAAGLPEPADDQVVTDTVAAAKQASEVDHLHVPKLEKLIRSEYAAAPALGAYARQRLRSAEENIVRVTREAYPAMRRRVLGGEQPRVPVRFACHYATRPGQDLLVVGDLPTLGQWDPGRGLHMAWADQHQWSLNAALPDVMAGQPVHYKYVLRSGGNVHWEPGQNHRRTLPDIREAAAPTYTDHWGQG